MAEDMLESSTAIIEKRRDVTRNKPEKVGEAVSVKGFDALRCQAV